jgi:curved DNA-binding protein CbpA
VEALASIPRSTRQQRHSKINNTEHASAVSFRVIMRCFHSASDKTCLVLFLVLFGMTRIRYPLKFLAEAKTNSPELTSTALRLHKIYTQHPPHDRQLYDILKVSPNATQAQITKSYRKLSRDSHPDKTKKNDGAENAKDQQFQLVQKAYEILKQDSTRMVYHRFGMTDPNLAVLLLMGPAMNPTLYQQRLSSPTSSPSPSIPFDSLDPELLRLIGYDDEMLQQSLLDHQEYTRVDFQSLRQHMEERRIRNIAAALVEHLRPIVEGRLSQQYSQYYSHALAQDCDRWKRLPLGAQIVRCVGRAYRHAGQDFLQKHNARMTASSSKIKPKQHLPTDAVIGVRKRWRTTKHWVEAGAASARLSVTEHFWKRSIQKMQKSQASPPQTPLETIEFQENDEAEGDDEKSFLPIGIDDETDVSVDKMEEERKLIEHDKAQKTLIQAMQIEALWKVCKVDVDRIVRRACERILSGEYFFFPSHTAASSGHASAVAPSHGWVAPLSGQAVDAEQARVMAAQAMVMFGDIMVQQSKQGTSWKEKK